LEHFYGTMCYSPGFIALGSVIYDFLNPDFTLIGEFDGRGGAMLEHCYAQNRECGAVQADEP
jgi:UDPglucose 6-dehydrogenase